MRSTSAVQRSANADGFPFILHFDGWGAREADELKRHEVIGHYRWPQE
ncbi:MAG: DUF1287 domain-containing protein [Merdibacter sp.]